MSLSHQSNGQIFQGTVYLNGHEKKQKNVPPLTPQDEEVQHLDKEGFSCTRYTTTYFVFAQESLSAVTRVKMSAVAASRGSNSFSYDRLGSKEVGFRHKRTKLGQKEGGL